MMPQEIYSYIMSFCNGFERENVKLVSKMFRSFKFEPRSIYPNKEVTEMNPLNIDLVCKFGYLDIIKLYTRRKPYNIDILLMSCKYGKYDIVEYYLSKHTPPQQELAYCAFHAYIHGHFDLGKYVSKLNFDDLIKYLDTKDILNYRSMIYRACVGGILSIVNKFVDIADVNVGLCGACAGGHIEIVKLMIKCGATHLKCAMRCAIGCECCDIIDFLVGMGIERIEPYRRCTCHYRRKWSVSSYSRTQ